MEGAVERQFFRLSDRILYALELALDQKDVEIASELGRALEESLTRFGGPDAVERRVLSDDTLEALLRLDDLKRSARVKE